MSIGLLFWVIMVLWLLFGLWEHWPATGSKPFGCAGHIVLWILLALLGWRVFGAALHN